MAKKRRFIIDIDEETNEKRLVVSDIILLLVLGSLIVLVVVLLLTAINKEKEKEDNFADLVVPVVEENSNSEFSIDLSALKGNSYLIKVVNYKNKDQVNSKELSYDLEIINENEVKIEVYKNQIKDNLATSNSGLLIEKNILSSKQKQEDNYKIVVSSARKLTKDDLLTIRITS